MKTKYYFRTVLSNKKVIDSRQLTARETVALTRITHSSVYCVGNDKPVRILL